MEKHLGDGPTPIKNRSVLDIAILGVVVVVAGVVVALSFTNTAKLANELGLPPLLTAGLVELLFASLLFIRARQRATRRNVPRFLSAGYFASLAFVTGVNMWGLGVENPTIGPVVGAAISGAMWLMESVLVWLWTASHRPHEKSLRELKKEAKARRKAARLSQEIEWMDWLAQKPDMGLIRKARREEEKRKAAVVEGMPIFFAQAESTTRNTTTIESTRGIGACVNTPANKATTTIRTDTSETGATNDNNINTRTGTTTSSTKPPVARYISENTTHTTSGIGDDEGNTSNTTSHSRTQGAGSTFDAATTGDDSTNEGTSTSDNGTRKSTTKGTDENEPPGTNASSRRESTKRDGTSTRDESSSTSDTNTNNTNTSTSEDTRKKSASTKRKTGGHHLRLVDADLEQVKLVALAIYEKEGKLPGRPRLRKEAKCRENQARRVLTELKEQLEAI